jgi:hypothetical protein
MIRYRVLLMALVSGAYIGLSGGSAQAQAITMTKVRDLFFGYCDPTPNATFTVAAADVQGAGSCTLATSARFEITGPPNGRLASVTLPATINITHGATTLTVTQTRSPAGGRPRLDATGHLTMFVGGSVRIPAGGLAVSGIFVNVADSLTVN